MAQRWLGPRSRRPLPRACVWQLPAPFPQEVSLRVLRLLPRNPPVGLGSTKASPESTSDPPASHVMFASGRGCTHAPNKLDRAAALDHFAFEVGHHDVKTLVQRGGLPLQANWSVQRLLNISNQRGFVMISRALSTVINHCQNAWLPPGFAWSAASMSEFPSPRALVNPRCDDGHIEGAWISRQSQG